MLKHPTVVAAFRGSSIFDVREWQHKPETENFLGAIRSPSFSDGQCIAPISLRYERHFIVDLSLRLTVQALVYIDDNGDPIIGNVQCSSNAAEVEAHLTKERAHSAKFKALARQDYLAYLRELTPRYRSIAIAHLANKIWVRDNRFVTNSPLDAQFLSACQNLGTKLIGPADLPRGGVVEFDGARCTAPVVFEFYGYSLSEDEDDWVNEDGMNYHCEVNILAGVTGRTPTGPDDLCGNLSVDTASFCFLPISEHDEKRVGIIS